MTTVLRMAGALLLSGYVATSGLPIAQAEEMAFTLKAAATMKELLAEQTGKRVAIRLDSGEEIEGTVGTVGNHLVQISKIVGKEFYDSVISIDKISAVRMRVRDKL